MFASYFLAMPELALLYAGLWAAGQGVLPPVKVSPDRPEHALHAGAGGSSADEVRIASAELLEGEHACFRCVQDVRDTGHAVCSPPEHLLLLGRCGPALGGRGVQHGVVQERHQQELSVRDVSARGAPGVSRVVFGIGCAIP